MHNTELLARSFIETAKADAIEDVKRLGVQGAAEYWADLARSQDYWSQLDTPQGHMALLNIANEIAWSS